jgi:uncharacterized protein YlxP (DUF503 family)
MGDLKTDLQITFIQNLEKGVSRLSHKLIQYLKNKFNVSVFALRNVCKIL